MEFTTNSVSPSPLSSNSSSDPAFIHYISLLCEKAKFFANSGTVNIMLDFCRQDIPVSELTNLLFYWIICGVIFMIESIVIMVTKIPFYYDLKIMALLWLILPAFSGSGFPQITSFEI
ncbi:TB2 DP1 [Cryptosporidium sp. chipmunk genotype I]|uniref:TB2 DP1 n=1 Tax=Cryptosporidium sp. chipmunk genotype I TaxID=1280935 RepID=UPI00351A72C2|nr:TB2 DP1 [Cryptosporidium sp. chipmunk genotype I]